MKAQQPTGLCLRDALASSDGRHIQRATQALLNKCLSFFGDDPDTTIQLERMLRTLECVPEDPRVDTLPLMFYFLHQRLDMVSRRKCNARSLVDICDLMDSCTHFFRKYHKASHKDWMRLLASNSAELQVAA